MRNCCSYHLKVIAIFLAVFGFAEVNSSANLYADTTKDRQDTMMQMNRYSIIESAYSHGSLGFDVGIGGQTFAMKDPHKLKSYNSSGASSSKTWIPKIYFVKGLDLPIDLGLTIGQQKSGGNTEMGGHIQWTIIQDIKYPAVAFRGSFSRLQTDVGDLSTSNFSIIAAKGFLQYFTAFGGIGLAHHSGKLEKASENMDYRIRPEDESFVSVSEAEVSHIIGLGVLALPPFLSVDMETQGSSKVDDRSYAAKLSVGL